MPDLIVTERRIYTNILDLTERLKHIKATSILESVIQMLLQLNLRIVAEGVETEAMANRRQPVRTCSRQRFTIVHRTGCQQSGRPNLKAPPAFHDKIFMILITVISFNLILKPGKT